MSKPVSFLLMTTSYSKQVIIANFITVFFNLFENINYKNLAAMVCDSVFALYLGL